MERLLFVIIGGFAWGSLRVESWLVSRLTAVFMQRVSPAVLMALAGAAKGALPVVVARFAVGTTGGLAWAALATISGQMWLGNQRLLPVLAGAFLAIHPALGAVVVAASAVLHFATTGSRLSRAAVGLALPPIFFYSWESDVYVLLGLVGGVALLHDAFVNRRPRTDTARRRRAVRRWALAFLLLAAISLYYANRYVYRGFGMHVALFRNGPKAVPVVALTFDDGPDPRYTPAILDVLEREGVVATFFVVGRAVEAYPEVVRRAFIAGHEIANHTYSHRNLLGTSRAVVDDEIDRATAAIEAAAGFRPVLFRPPRGMYTQHVLDALEARGMTLVLWSLSSEDWAEVPARAVYRRVVDRVRPGDVILFHDAGDILTALGASRANTVRALPLIIRDLKARGYRFVTVTEMMILAGLAGNGDADDGRD